MSNLGLLDGMFKGGFGTPDARMLIERWHDAFHLTENWDSYTYDDGGKNCSSQTGLFTSYVYHNHQGFPILRCVEASTKTHAVWPSECEMAWTEFMQYFTRIRIPRNCTTRVKKSPWRDRALQNHTKRSAPPVFLDRGSLCKKEHRQPVPGKAADNTIGFSFLFQAR